jgi:hypothetical protein
MLLSTHFPLKKKLVSMNYFILENRKPLQVHDYNEWKQWLETAKREVKRTELPNGIIIATEFIGQAECLDETKPPLLFETMIRGGISDGIVQQYTSWEHAEEGHEKAVQLASTE